MGSTGTNVLLTGGGFQGVTAVEFNGTRASFTYRSSTEVGSVVPSGASTGPIRLVTTNGTFTTTELFHLPARLNTFNPGSGMRGDVITIDGQNLDGATRVLFNGVDAEFTVASSTRLTAVVPANATTGRITVVTPAGSVLSSGTFNVIPVLDGFTPDHATVGTPVTLAGAGFTNIVWVRLGGIDMGFTVLNPTTVRAIVPLDAFSGAIRLRNLSGVEVQAPGTFVVDGARPVVTSFTPSEGAPGTVVQITGKGLATTSRIQFNGLDAVFGAPTTTSVQATVPADATTGPIAVTTLDGIAVSVSGFTVRQPVVTLTIEPGLASDEIVLRWDASATGYVLQSASVLAPNAPWSTVPVTPVVEGNKFRVTLVISPSGATYYRLRK